MKNLLKEKKFLIIGTLFLLFGAIIVLSAIYRNSYALENRVYTREEVEEMVVSTSLSYFYKNLYSDYSMYLKDQHYGYTKVTTSGTYAWRSMDHSPEDVSRNHKYFIDCSGFAYMIYKYALGYDFSDHYQNARYNYFKNGYKYAYYNMPNSNITNYPDIYYSEKMDQELFSEMVMNTALEPDGTFYSNISKNAFKEMSENISDVTGAYINNSTSNKTQAVYYFEADGTTISEVQEQIKDKSAVMAEELKSILRPGDIVNYYFRTKNDDGTVSGNSGHVMIYVGGAINQEEQGFIHSAGYDYTYNDDGTMKSPGNDTYSVRYDNFERLASNILTENDTLIGYKISVERPINQFCDDDVCSFPSGSDSFSKAVDLDLVNQSVNRSDFSRLRLEQYTQVSKVYTDTLTTDSLEENNFVNGMSNFNSVNVGDTFSYIFRVQNKANFSYCSRGNYYTESGCENAGYEWRYAEGSDNYSYKDITITNVLPDNVEYIPDSCSRDCTYDEESRTITWKEDEIEPASGMVTNVYSASVPTYVYSYQVKALEEGVIVNSGIEISSGDKSLKMSSIETSVNPTINGINMDLMKSYVDKFNDLFSSGLITHNGTTITGNYKQDLNSLNTNINLAEGEFVKMLYYNAFGIDIGYLRAGGNSSGDMLTALFNKRSVTAGSETVTIYYPKTDEDFAKLTGNQKLISDMLVPGLYGGRLLRGNDNGDRESILRVRDNSFNAGGGLNDLEFGDIIFYVFNNLRTITTFMYYGQDDAGYPIFVKFTEDGLVYYDQEASGGMTGFYKFANLYSRELFWVLRPSRVYGTTVVYDYNYEGKEDETYIAYGTYKELNNPERSGGYKVEYVCGEGIDCPEEEESKFIFEGWYADSSYNEKIEEEDTLKSSEAHKIYAKWGNEKIILPIVEREGYRFLGWYRDSEYSYKEGAGGEEYEVNGNKVLYARLEKEEVEITSDELEIENGNIYLEEVESEIERYKSLIEIEGESNYRIEVYSPEEERIESGRIYTGSITRIYRGEEKVGEYRNIVKGDVNRTGTVSMADVMKIASYLTEEGVMEEEYNKMAADINRDNNIGMNDIMRIVNYLIEGGSL